MPLGLPHSEFLSWSEDDQDKAMVWNLRESSRCPTCGTFPEEWYDEKGKYVDPPPYTLESRRCPGCVDLEEERKMIPEEERAGISLFFRKRRRSQGKR